MRTGRSSRVPTHTKSARFFLIYRHWIWSDLQRLAFEQMLKGEDVFEPIEMVMVGRGTAFMFT